MRMFFSQYKKVIGLCAVPIVLTVVFFGYRMVFAQSNQAGEHLINTKMQALLDSEIAPTPSAVHSGALQAAVAEDSHPESMQPASPAQLNDFASQTNKPKSTSKPKRTPKPKATKQPKQTQNPDFKININKAASEELLKLSGIGDSKAQAIITYREQVHNFKTIEELMKVKGIGPKIFAKIKEHLEL
jgi:comEA protein